MLFFKTMSDKIPIKIKQIKGDLPTYYFLNIKGQRTMFEIKRRHDGVLAYVEHRKENNIEPTSLV